MYVTIILQKCISGLHLGFGSGRKTTVLGGLFWGVKLLFWGGGGGSMFPHDIKKNFKHPEVT